MLHLRTFGGLTLEGASRELGGAAGQRRPMALLLLLAVAGERGFSRDKLLGLLWPDSDAEHARSALRQTLYSLRRDLALPELFQGTTDLRLNTAVIQSDIAAFDAAVAAGDKERVVALYEGPLADGFFLSKAPEFERWLEAERRVRAQQFSAAAVALASEASRAGDSARAVVYWRRAATEDRLSARIALELMRSLADAGDRAGAIQHAKVYEGVIRAELDAAPDPSVAAFAEQLRTTPTEPAIAEARDHGVTTATPEPVVSPKASAAGGEARSVSSTSHRRRLAIGAAVTIAAVTATALIYVRRSSTARVSDPTLVAVAPYEVLDPTLSLWREGLMDVLAHNLDGAGPLRTVAPSVTLQHWSGRAHVASAAELARRTRARIVVFGYLFRIGSDSVRAVASLYDARAKRNRTVECRGTAARMDRLTDSLTVTVLREVDEWVQLGAGRRASFGGTSSIEALKAFLRGEQFFRRSQWDSARVAYEQAVAHDSAFALPYRRLGNVTGWLQGETDSAAIAYRLKAGSLNHRLGLRDSLLVVIDSLRGAAAGAPTYLEEWPFTRRLLPTVAAGVRSYPNDPELWYVLGESHYHYGLGPALSVPERSTFAAFVRAIELDSAFTPAYVHIPELALNLTGRELAQRYVEAQLRRQLTDTLKSLAGLLRHLLAPGADRSPQVQRLLDTVSLNALYLARTATARWPDSAQTALRISRTLAGPRRLGREPTPATVRGRARLLAGQLGFRGHLREAQRVIGTHDAAIAFKLTLGGLPADSIDGRIARLVENRSRHSALALHWWGARRNTVALSAFLASARARAQSGATPAQRSTATYDSLAAQAYLALSRLDTLDALRRFVGLPDTLCLACFPDRLTRARLLAAAGRDREALRDLQEQRVGEESPFDVLFALERARVAERLGDRPLAARDYRFVVSAWWRGDPEVQPFVDEARRGLARVEGRRP